MVLTTTSFGKPHKGRLNRSLPTYGTARRDLWVANPPAGTCASPRAPRRSARAKHEIMHALLSSIVMLAFAHSASALRLSDPAAAARLTRRSLLAGVPAATTMAFALGASADEATAVDGAAVDGAAAAPPAAPAAPTSVTYDELKKLLIQCKDEGVCKVEKVAFTEASGESADAIFVDGSRVPVIGIPKDDPGTDSSPYKLVAKLRDAKVPYTFPFSENLAKYRSK